MSIFSSLLKKIGIAATVTGAIVFVAVFSATVFSTDRADAIPQFANETGLSCTGCHVGKMNSKRFTADGEQF